MDQVSININLITAMIQIIDRSAQTGTFAGPDLSTVGRVRDELVQIVNENQPQRTEGLEGDLAKKVVQ